MRTRITATEMTADFRVLPYVTRPGAPVHTRATFVVEDRVPGLNRTADSPTPASARTLRATGPGVGEATVEQETARP